MDYENKYRKALEKAKRLHSEPTGGTERIVCEQIFPELRWSEDERIRKALITAVSGTFKDNTLWHTDVTREEALAWLEKQGEQKQEEKPRYNIGDVICDKSCTTLNKEAQPNMEIVDIKNGMYICDKGSFPVSQQNEYELVSKKIDTKLNDDSVSNELREASFAHARKEIKNPTCPDNEEFELVYTFEEGAKWEAAQKPVDKVEPKFKVKYAGNEYNVFDVKDIAGVTYYGIEDEPNHIDYVQAENCERVGGYSIKEKGSPYPTKPAKFSEQKTAWSEEDEEMAEKLLGWLNTLINYIQGDATVSLDLYRERTRQVEIIKTWLKSLKALNTWEPSDKQIKALENFTRSVAESGYFSPYDDNTKLLYSLLEDLKKLK